MLKGLLAGGITLGIAAVFPEALVLSFFAAVLGLTSGGYPGLAMADPINGRPGLEWAVAITLLCLGLVGLWISPLVLAGAWILHWVWSAAHHFTSLGDGLPGGYPEFCLLFDLVIAGFVGYVGVAGI